MIKKDQNCLKVCFENLKIFDTGDIYLCNEEYTFIFLEVSLFVEANSGLFLLIYPFKHFDYEFVGD